MSTIAWPERQEWEGAAGMDAFMEEWIGTWAEWSVQINQIREGEPGQVVVDCTQRGVLKADDAPVEMHFAQLWTLNEEGLNIRMRMYADLEEALGEAGVRAA